MHQLKPEYIERIKGDINLRRKLQEALKGFAHSNRKGVSNWSLLSYLKQNHQALTCYDALLILSTYYNKNIEELVEVAGESLTKLEKVA